MRERRCNTVIYESGNLNGMDCSAAQNTLDASRLNLMRD